MEIVPHPTGTSPGSFNWKSGGRVKSWKRRWFVLTEDSLIYYLTPDVNSDYNDLPSNPNHMVQCIENEAEMRVKEYQLRFHWVWSGDTGTGSGTNCFHLFMAILVLRCQLLQARQYSRSRHCKGVIPLDGLNIRITQDRTKEHTFELYSSRNELIKASKADREGTSTPGERLPQSSNTQPLLSSLHFYLL
ncbi:unnamed protein product [Echinostoma caproni]|uniref:PH domain-containing protein n=1 Tax=Echinostoma caproni TaxID=27848 RepID=A0A183ANN1_9TREM|nr:unnamed protein product [Echinostoma caproni]